MPENPPHPDDQFADLYTRLPDPRARETGAAAPAATPSSRRAARQAASGPEAPASAPARGAEGASAPEVTGPDSAAAPAGAAPAAAAPAGATRSQQSAGPQVAPRPGATATLDDLFTGNVTTSEVGYVPRPDKRKRRVGAWIALVVVLALVGGVAAGGFWVWNTYEEQIREFLGTGEPKDFEEGLANGEVLVTISEGDNPNVISQTLFDSGVTKTPDAFYDMLIDTGQAPTFYPGVYSLQLQMTSPAALAALEDPANKRENTAQLREGLTVEQSLPLLADGIGLPIEDFQAAVANPADYGVSAGTLEGWLFPATYTFDPGLTAVDVIRTLVDRTVESLDSAGVPVEDRERILTIASIIQREARFEDDFYKVSRVIQNRLDAGNQETYGLLQMDSTAQYGYGEIHDGTVSSTEEALRDDNPWNTYVHPGLPVGPIANPGDMAIDAAMHPVDGPWLYFVTVNLDTGETVFTNTVSEHEAAVTQWQQWCSDHPDSGC